MDFPNSIRSTAALWELKPRAVAIHVVFSKMEYEMRKYGIW